MMGPLEESLTFMAVNISNGDKTINPSSASMMSMTCFIFCCHSGIRPVLISVNTAPNTLLLFTEPDRISKLSGTIFMSTSNSLKLFTIFSNCGLSSLSSAITTNRMLLCRITCSSSFIEPNSGRYWLIPLLWSLEAMNPTKWKPLTFNPSFDSRNVFVATELPPTNNVGNWTAPDSNWYFTLLSKIHRPSQVNKNWAAR